jgi:hypothetical protein
VLENGSLISKCILKYQLVKWIHLAQDRSQDSLRRRAETNLLNDGAHLSDVIFKK